MICEHCGAFFCPSRDSTPGDQSRQRYCDHRCLDNAASRRRKRAAAQAKAAGARPRCSLCRAPYTPSPGCHHRCPECWETVRTHGLTHARKLGAQKAAQAAWDEPCPSGKKKYPDVKTARKAARGVMAQYYRGFPSGWISVYECKKPRPGACGAWHLTSKVRGSNVGVANPTA